MVDAVAKRYGCLPHEVLDLSAWQLSLAVECWRAANATEAHRLGRMDGMVFPVVIVGGA